MNLPALSPALPLDALARVDALRLAARICNSIEIVEGRAMVRNLPSAAERAQLTAALAFYDARLVPVVKVAERARRGLAAMFSGYTSLRNVDAEEQCAIYLVHLRDVPIGALEEALEDVRCSRIPEARDWPPQAPRLYQAAAVHAGKMWRDVHQLRQALLTRELLPEPPSDEQRAEVAQKLGDLAKELRAAGDRERLEELQRRADQQRADQERSVLAEYASLGREPIRNSAGELVSPALADQAGKKPTPKLPKKRNR